MAQPDPDEPPEPAEEPAEEPAPPDEGADWGELSASSGALPTKWVTNDGVITFKGRTFKEILQEIAARPDKEAGSMFCKPYMRLGGTKPGVVGRCEVTVTCTRTLPVWMHRDGASAEAKAEWDRFAGAVKRHEDQHAAVQKEVYAKVCEQAIGKDKAGAQAALEAARAKAKAASDDHDTRTGNGTREGCTLDVSKTPAKGSQADEAAEPAAEEPAFEAAPEAEPAEAPAEEPAEAPAEEPAEDE